MALEKRKRSLGDVAIKTETTDIVKYGSVNQYSITPNMVGKTIFDVCFYHINDTWFTMII